MLPDEVRQRVTLQTVDSLVEYVNRFKAGNTVLFADIQASKIVAVLDFHEPDHPHHGAHIAELVLPHSEEWNTWKGVDGKLVGQLEFARFLEENEADVVAPSGADLREACRDLHAVRKVDFRKAVRTSTDNESFEYVEETETKSRSTGTAVEVPSKFELSLPVYFGGANTPLFAFLRWKLDEGALFLGVKLHRLEHVRQAVFKQIVTEVQERTERTAIFGKPN